MTVQAHHDSYENFADRHIGPNTSDLSKILSFLGYATLNDLSNAAVPVNIQNPQPLAIPDGVSEAEVLAELKAFADANEVLTSMIGLGYYGTHTPV